MADYYVDGSGNLKKKKDEPDYYIDENGNQIKKETVLVKDLPMAPAQTGDGKWLKGGAFADGWQFGDLTKTILGTTRDVKENVTHAVLEATENLIDTTAFGVGQVAGWFGADDFRDNVGEFIAKEPLTKGEMGAKVNKVLDFTTPEGLISKAIMGDNTEGNSILGDKSDGLVQSGAHLVGSKALQMVGVPSALTMGVNAFGSEIEQAYKNDATHKEAFISGAVAAGAEILIEKLFGGIKFGGKTHDEGATKTLSRNISKRIVRSILKWVGDTAGEGLEEYLTESTTNVARKLTYADEMTLKDILWSEEHLDAFVGGAIMGGAAGGFNATKAGVNGVEYASGLTANEEKVVRHEYEKRISEKTKNGEKVDKAKIWDEVIEDMEKGYISTDTIEEVLGDKSYDNLKQEADEFNTLYNKEGGMSKAQQDRLAELEAKNKSKPYKVLLDEAKKKRTDDVRAKTIGNRLGESYREAGRVYEKFQIDPDKYKGRNHEDAAKKTIQSAIDAGANNTNRVHDLVEMAASVSADTGKTFTFKSGEDIKNAFIERQTAEIAKLEAIKNRTAEQDAELAEMKSLLAKVKSGEVIVDGDITEDGIVLNLDSNKPLNRVVGHEITHHFEPGKGKNSKYYTELRDSLFAYAKTIGRDIDAELAAKKAQYAGVADANPEAELVADLVGDFLFTDNNYIKKLSVENRNVFQKLWDKIKYLAKVATAGSKEARELARLEKAFADIYREGVNGKGNTKYSMSSIANTFFGDENMTAEQFKKADYRETQGYKDYVDQCVNNLRQSDPNFNESAARQEIESSIDGIVQVAIAAKQAGYDIYDDPQQRTKKDSKNRLLFSSLEPNSDYFTSNDISTICDKRKNFADIYDDIVKAEEAKGVPVGKRFFDNVDNYFYLHKLMADKGLTQPCRQCYVESMRKNLAPMANAFLRLVQETNPDNRTNDQLYHQSGKQKGELKTSNASTREFVLSAMAAHPEYGLSAENLTVEMLTTEDGLAQLKIQAPLIYEAFNSFYGQSKPKMPKSATPFRFGELTALLTDEKGRIKKSLVDKINSTGGFRLQSYSDFQIQNYTDVLQVLFEAGTLGLNGHAYTKVPAFLEATEGTNLKRNISIFMYKDGNEWKLDKNDSFPYSLEEIYEIVKADKTGNTGIIAVSQNADMSAWIMANDFIAYGIPFHKSGLKMGTVRDTDVKTDDGRVIKGYSGTIDHTKQQTEVWAKATEDHKALTKVKKGINIYSFWDFDNKSNLSKNDLIEKNVKAYIDACEMAGYLPKFRAYVMDNGKVLNDVLKYSKELGFVGKNATIEDISFQYKGYTIPYGYYKFLGDFGMFTPDGKASPQNTLSLKNYDFDKAVQFFAESETLRRNEILQQFSNGAEREKYRESDLTAEQLQDIIKSKRGEVVQDVVSRHASSLSNEGDDVFAPSKNDIYGSDFRVQEIAPVQETAPAQEESVAPVAEDDFAPAEETNIDSLTDEDAPMGDIAPVRVLVRKKINKPMKTVKPDDSTGAAPSGFDPVSHLQYEYGSLPVGENPVREDSLPKSTTGKDKVSLTARTVKGAEATPDEFVDLLDKEVVGGRFSYLPIKNTDTVKKAYDSIVQKGWEAARGEWESRVRRGEVSAELSATGELLLNNAAKAGDRKAWLSILHDYQIMGTNAGQAIQAMHILKTLTPDDGLYMIERSVEQMVEDMKLGTEIVIDEDLKQKYLDSKTDSEKDAALDALAKNVASQIPSTAMDKWTALRYLNMLGNLRTQGRNIFGNLGMSATNRLKNTIASAIEAIAEKVSGGKFKRTKSAFVGRGLLKASKNDFANVEQVALNGGKFNDSMAKSVQFQQKVQDSRKIFKLMPLEKYRRATNWAMSQGDLVFSKAAYGRALAGYLKANGITETDFSKIDQQTLDEARAYAVKEAQEVTFRDNNWLSDWVSKMGRRKDTPKVGKLISEGVMPFRKTPANILLRAEEYSPLGILNATAKSIKAVKGDISGAEVVNSWAKALTGTGLFALGMLLNNLGVLSGGPDDDENKEQFENQYGQQNYALKIGDYSFTIDFLSPSAMPLLMGAQLNELRQDKDVELKDLETSLMSIADPMIEMSMLQGVNDSLDNIRYAESNMGQFLVNSCVNYLTQGLTNSFLGQLERSFEGERMTTYIDKDSKTPQWLQKALGKASAKTPGWDYQQVPYVDAWGETEDIAPLPGALENTLSPSYISHEMTDDVYDELNRLNDAQSDINVYPQTPDKTVTFDDADGNRHVDYNLTAEEYVELSQLQGQTQKELIEDILSSELYDGLTDKEKAKAVQLAYQYAKEYSRQEVLGADGFSSKWMSEAGDDIVNAIIAHVSDEKTFAYNYPEKYSFFMSNGISYEQYASADEAGKRAYTWAYENPGKYKMYQKLSGDYMTFYGYKSDLNGIKSDKDSSGKSITGSRKEKVIEYINNMDADYGEKIILYKSEYPSDDTYNNDIVEYLNSRNDISYDYMVTILKELGFTVDKNGNVSW